MGVRVGGGQPLSAVGFLLASIASTSVSAQVNTTAGRAPGAVRQDANPKILPGLQKATTSPTGRKGPLAGLADKASDEGFTFHWISANFFEANPSSGLVPGRAENSMYNIVGVDYDLSKRWGLTGSSLHYETTFFTFNRNYPFLGQVGDSGLGYQGTANTRPVIPSLVTFEQKLLDGRLGIEFGRTNPNHYYALQLCNSLDSCFQDVLYFNAGFPSPQYSVWGGNVAYKITPTIYAQAGAFADNGNPRIGYDLDRERNQGVLGIGEIGYKSDFDTALYPSRASVTGFYNSSPHQDFSAFSAFNLGTTSMKRGTGGVVLQGQQIVWRADGGTNRDDKAPTAVALYGSAGTGVDSTTPILADIHVGATLQSPFRGRPADRFGVQFRYERINQNYANYLSAANFVAGGPGTPFNPNKYVAELNAHIQLPGNLAFEPVFQYAWNLNSFYNPATAARPRDGIFVCGVLIIPVGALLGLTPS